MICIPNNNGNLFTTEDDIKVLVFKETQDCFSDRNK